MFNENLGCYLFFTDTHLFPWNRKKLIAEIISHNPAGVFFTGDISQCAYLLIKDLEFIFNNTDVPIYFILGNHCYWGSSFEKVNREIRKLSAKYKNCHWLHESDLISLNKNTALIGANGFYDGRVGDSDYIKITLDKLFIKEIRQAKCWENTLNKFREIADNSTHIITDLLTDALEEHNTVYLLTHVPPFELAVKNDCWIDKKYYSAYDVNFFMGQELERIMGKNENKDKRLIVLSGHTHHETTFKIGSNIECHVGRGAYHKLAGNEVLYI